VAYADDIAIFSKNMAEHVRDVRRVFQVLIDGGLHIDLKKCDFYVQETKLLELMVSTEGIRMDPEKVRAIEE
jgi:Reverse transcriptase (RNA-dependent DNA polymerase)